MKSCDMKTTGHPQTGRVVMQYQAYQPLLPSGNKYLQQRWDKASYDLHRRKVKSAKPTVSTTAPHIFGHLTLNLKKLKLEEDLAIKIQRENNLLTKKISHIMRTTGAVDNRNYYDRKSLGKEKRQLELLRITKENEMILLRLSHCKPHYNAWSWQEDWLKTLKVMDSIARYPRGRANQQKYQEQEKLSKKSSERVQHQTTTIDAATHNTAGSQTTSKTYFEENKKAKGRSKKRNAEK